MKQAGSASSNTILLFFTELINFPITYSKHNYGGNFKRLLFHLVMWCLFWQQFLFMSANFPLFCRVLECQEVIELSGSVCKQQRKPCHFEIHFTLKTNMQLLQSAPLQMLRGYLSHIHKEIYIVGSSAFAEVFT